MGSWWRSEHMTYVNFIVSDQAATSCIRELGAVGCLQFIDLNPELTPFQRRFVSYIKRTDELERKIRYVHGELKKMDIPIAPVDNLDEFIKGNKNEPTSYQSGGYLLDSLETQLEQLERQLLDLNRFNDKLSEEFQKKVEYSHLLAKANKFVNAEKKLDQVESALNRASYGAGDYKEQGVVLSPLNVESQQNEYDMMFSNVAGTIATSEKTRFERMLYRATRGNCYLRFAPLSNKALDANEKFINKVCFIIFYKSSALEIKIKRICEGFSANLYDLSKLNQREEIQKIQSTVLKEIQETKEILSKNLESRRNICLGSSHDLEKWLLEVKREKSIYHTLNLFKADYNGFLSGRAWILTSKIAKAKNVIARAHIKMNIQNTSVFETANTLAIPPTHFQTNDYTIAFQEFVNTYGVPHYQEANPALFTAATFPFFFGVMYGDIGHGGCLLLFGLYLIITEKWYNNKRGDEMAQGMYMARYMLFAMGIMSVYAGLIYNDYFSIGLNLFGSHYTWDSHESGVPGQLTSYYGDPSNVYPFGVDPAWHIAGNELLFFNSMKMKMSVILGIFHMTFGIVLRGMNCIYFRKWTDFFMEFLPMIIFDVAFFGYMVILIFVKWSIDWNQRMALGTCSYDANGVIGACQLTPSTSCFNVQGNVCDALTPLNEVCPLGYGGLSGGCQPPNLITTLINIALKPGTVDEPMYAGQAGVQTFILLIAFICVPWLLCVKPFYLKYTHKPAPSKSVDETHSLLHEVDPAMAHGGGGGGGHDDHGEFNFGEIFIHQAIETIEFVLGMVSNTASYLRLWALSLAHTELATVFWEKAMLSAIETGNPVAIFIGFAIFAVVTFGVLLAMDVLECFLHALRLHWVEFQNKFFKADGYKFQPFDFKTILEKTMLD